MQLGNILTTASTAVVVKPVTFKVLGRDPEGKLVQATASAVFALVDEGAEAEADRAAYAYLRDQKDSLGTQEDVDHTKRLWFLMAALRDVEDPSRQFCPNAEFAKLRTALVKAQVDWLMDQYAAYLSDEYPEIPSDEQRRALIEAAAGK